MRTILTMTLVCAIASLLLSPVIEHTYLYRLGVFTSGVPIFGSKGTLELGLYMFLATFGVLQISLMPSLFVMLGYKLNNNRPFSGDLVMGSDGIAQTPMRGSFVGVKKLAWFQLIAALGCSLAGLICLLKIPNAYWPLVGPFGLAVTGASFVLKQDYVTAGADGLTLAVIATEVLSVATRVDNPMGPAGMVIGFVLATAVGTLPFLAAVMLGSPEERSSNRTAQAALVALLPMVLVFATQSQVRSYVAFSGALKGGYVSTEEPLLVSDRSSLPDTHGSDFSSVDQGASGVALVPKMLVRVGDWQAACTHLPSLSRTPGPEVLQRCVVAMNQKVVGAVSYLTH